MNFDEQKKIFSQNLRRLLEERGLEQVAVAVALGVPPQTFNSWAKGKALPRMDKVQALADYLRIPKTALMDPPGTDPATVEALLLLRPDLDELLDVARKLSASDVRTLTELARRLGGGRDE